VLLKSIPPSAKSRLNWSLENGTRASLAHEASTCTLNSLHLRFQEFPGRYQPNLRLMVLRYPHSLFTRLYLIAFLILRHHRCHFHHTCPTVSQRLLYHLYPTPKPSCRTENHPPGIPRTSLSNSHTLPINALVHPHPHHPRPPLPSLQSLPPTLKAQPPPACPPPSTNSAPLPQHWLT